VVPPRINGHQSFYGSKAKKRKKPVPRDEEEMRFASRISREVLILRGGETGHGETWAFDQSKIKKQNNVVRRKMDIGW